MSLVKKILIANRGEIACRIMRTSKKLGVETVAVYSDIDKDSKFVSMADQAYHVGPNPSSQSYLNSDKILQIAIDSKCQALHPGFGFLSENSNFANQCTQNGVIFVGPPVSAINSMGSKSESKKIMTAANVPVVPGYHQDNQQPSLLASEADKIGYPVLIKAVSGGGGKGMRIVHQKSQFLEALESCKRESLKSFRDDRVILEKYIAKSRHIEVQIFGDMFGNYVHLYERDCSIQRRHQKVVEEAPSNSSEDIRKLICSSAVSAAKAVGYYNAGTVQFIFDEELKQHYFMEMNTRLQVEHPISEMITGLDFVEWQLLVASGFKLPKKQEEIQKKGHSIEVRIYAEDPFNNFLPTYGTLNHFREPKEEDGIRIETGVREHDAISTFYDAMIAKLITYGKDRAEAVSLMQKALASYRVVGFNTNLRFLKTVIGHDVFKQGDYDTGYIEKYMDHLLHKQTEVATFDIISSALLRNIHKRRGVELPNQLLNFRNVKGLQETHKITISETCLSKPLSFDLNLEYHDHESGTAIIHSKQHSFKIQPSRTENQFTIEIDTQVQNREYFVQADTVYLFDAVGDAIGFTFTSDQLQEVAANAGSAELRLKAPMPGTISMVYVKAGATVKKNEPIIAMEAMKMELVIRAEFDCKVASIHAKEGEFVDAGKVVVELENL